MKASILAHHIRGWQPRTDEEVGIQSIILAALYAANMAVKMGYPRQPVDRARFHAEVVHTADAMIRELEPPKRWLAGYYVNDALFRMDVAFEAIVNYLARPQSGERLEEAIPRAVEKGFPATSLPHWKKISKEVNAFKHRNPEQTKLYRSGRAIFCHSPKLFDALKALIVAGELALQRAKGNG